jgi:hypothetical protein
LRVSPASAAASACALRVPHARARRIGVVEVQAPVASRTPVCRTPPAARRERRNARRPDPAYGRGGRPDRRRGGQARVAHRRRPKSLRMQSQTPVATHARPAETPCIGGVVGFAGIGGGTQCAPRVPHAGIAPHVGNRRSASHAGGAGRPPSCRTCPGARGARGSLDRAVGGAMRDGRARFACLASRESRPPQGPSPRFAAWWPAVPTARRFAAAVGPQD